MYFAGAEAGSILHLDGCVEGELWLYVVGEERRVTLDYSIVDDADAFLHQDGIVKVRVRFAAPQEVTNLVRSLATMRDATFPTKEDA
jgi:hypothetical protein